MTHLTTEQRRQLNMYSIYLDLPDRTLFTLESLLDQQQVAEVLNIVQMVSASPNRTVAASYLTRRFGMFIAQQFYQLAAYDEVYAGTPKRLQFGARMEYGKLSVSIFIQEEDWQQVEDYERIILMRKILDLCHELIKRIREVSSISPLTCWENIFGFLLWHYHELLSNPATQIEARNDFEILKSDALWEGIAPHSLWSTYLKGREPSDLLNTVVRTTCCFSKDVPGLLQCGFCPQKK